MNITFIVIKISRNQITFNKFQFLSSICGFDYNTIFNAIFADSCDDDSLILELC